MDDSDWPYIDWEKWLREVTDSDDPNCHRYILTHDFEVYVGKPGSLELMKRQRESDPLPLTVPPELRT